MVMEAGFLYQTKIAVWPVDLKKKTLPWHSGLLGLLLWVLRCRPIYPTKM